MNGAPNIDWPDALSDYTPLEVIATGRLSRVVHATEKATNRDVAIKILHAHLADERPVRRRLRREFAAVRRLEHPAIVRAGHIIDDEDTVALVMDYVDGASVRRLVEHRGAMSWHDAKVIIDDVLAAVGHAHERGIWHRDLNAEHVLIGDDGRARVVGFGLARVDELAALTMHTRVLGALEAMAPERVLGMDYDGRADLYSVGAVAHELLLGHPPTDGTMQSAFSRAEGSASVAETLPDHLPRQARYLLERSLVGDVSARFATAEQMRRALESTVDEKMWRRWAGRDGQRCTECNAPALAALGECVECGHEFHRLVRNPGGGQWLIQVVSPNDDTGAEQWFSDDPEPGYLRTETFEALMALLEDHEDTKRIADWSDEYRFPPYILLERLTRDDARRIHRLLLSRDIPHRVRRRLPSRTGRLLAAIRQHLRLDEVLDPATENSSSSKPRARRRTSSDKSRPNMTTSSAGQVPLKRPPAGVLVVPYLLIALPFLWTITAVRRNMIAMILFAVVVLPLLVISSLTLQIDDVYLAMTAGAFAVGIVGVRTGATLLQTFFQGDGDRPTVDGQSLMVPTDALDRIQLTGDGLVMPAESASILRDLDDDAVRREIQEMLILTATVSRRIPDSDAEALATVVSRILTVGQRLDGAVGHSKAANTATLYTRLERVETRLDRTPRSDGQALEEERTELLHKLETLDEATVEVMMLRSALQRIRGMLLDMLSDDEHAAVDDDYILSFDTELEQTLLDIETRVEAAEEVADL